MRASGANHQSSDGVDPCAAARSVVATRSDTAKQARTAAERAAALLREAEDLYQARLDALVRAETALDTRGARAAKESAHVAFREAIRAARARSQVEDAAAGWLNEINRINNLVRAGQLRIEREREAVTALLPDLDKLTSAADTTRFTAETAAEAYRAAGDALAACEAEAAAAATAAAAAIAASDAAAAAAEATALAAAKANLERLEIPAAERAPAEAEGADAIGAASETGSPSEAIAATAVATATPAERPTPEEPVAEPVAEPVVEPVAETAEPIARPVAEPPELVAEAPVETESEVEPIDTPATAEADTAAGAETAAEAESGAAAAELSATAHAVEPESVSDVVHRAPPRPRSEPTALRPTAATDATARSRRALGLPEVESDEEERGRIELDGGSPSAIVDLLSGNPRALTALVETLAPGDPTAATGWAKRLSALADALVAAAIDAAWFEFPAGHTFWDLFESDQSRDVALALAALGYRTDAAGRFVDDRVPGPRELSLAVGQAGLNPVRIRRWPTQAEAVTLFQDVHLDAAAFVAVRAPSLTLDEIGRILGHGCPALVELGSEWPRLRSLLLEPVAVVTP